MGYEATLFGSLSTSELDLVVMLVEAEARGLVLFEEEVFEFRLGDGPAGVADGDALYLVGDVLEALWYGIDDSGFDGFPVGVLAGEVELRDGFVVAPASCVEPESEYLGLFLGRVDPDSCGLGFCIEAGREVLEGEVAVEAGVNILSAWSIGAVSWVVENQEPEEVLSGRPLYWAELRVSWPLRVGSQR